MFGYRESRLVRIKGVWQGLGKVNGQRAVRNE